MTNPQYPSPGCWARTWRRSDISMDRADGFRDGVAACAAMLRMTAANLQTRAAGETDRTPQMLLAFAAANLEDAATGLGRLEPAADVTGLCERGS